LTELRKIKAKFESKCLKCEGLTLTGSTVYWEKGKGVFHEKCVPPEKPQYVLKEYCHKCGTKCLDESYCPTCKKKVSVVDKK